MKQKRFKYFIVLSLLVIVGSAVWNLNKNWDDWTTPVCEPVSIDTPQIPKEFIPNDNELTYITSEEKQKLFNTIDSAANAHELDYNLFFALSEVLEKYNTSGTYYLAPEFLSDNPESISITSGGCKTELLAGVGISPIKKEDMEDLKTYAKLFIEETTNYPLQWWDYAVPPFIVFVKALRVQGEIVGGVEQGAVIYNISSINNPEETKRVIHHELMHWVEHSTRTRGDSAWPEPKNSYTAVYDLTSDSNFIEHPENGFITGYAKTNPLEDKAEVYAFLFTPSLRDNLERYANRDPELSKKVKYLKDFIKARVTNMDEGYFESL